MSLRGSPTAGIVLSGTAHESVVSELAAALEQHIGSRKGITGMAMKLGFNTLKASRPEFSSRAVQSLLPEVLTALAPLHAEFQTAAQGDFAQFLSRRAEGAAGAVLARLDARLAASHNAAAKAVYQRFRGSALDELKTLMPTVGAVLGKYAA